MHAVADALGYVNVVVFAALAVVCIRQWAERRDEPARWAALTFALLATVSLTSRLIELVYGEAGGGPWVDKAIIVLIVFFPYLLYRFSASFSPPRPWVEVAAAALTAAVAVWALFIPEVPGEEEAWPARFAVFVTALLVQWTLLSLYVAVRLWRAGRGQPTVVRYRMRFLAVAAVALSLVLILAGAAAGDPPSWLELASRLLTLASALLFFVGLAPPRFVRMTWRGGEEELLRRSVDDLMIAANPEEVTRTVLPPMAAIVGADAVALVDDEDRVLGSHELTREREEELERALARPPIERPRGRFASPLRLAVSSGSVVAWTSPYAPFFGKDDFDLLRSLGGLAMLALERSRLFAQEREARVALEEADELKSQFVALASHELRHPAAVIHGIAATLHLRGDELTGGQLHQLRRTLYEQTDRLRRLVDQLLDLSRLEAQSVRIEPKPLWVRSRVEELVLMVSGDRAKDVTIDIPPDLQTIVDPDAFDRVVSNLVANALRYGEAPVRVYAEQPDRYFRLSVEDRGDGVPPEFVPQLFERFTRSKASREAMGGAGLGLAIAQSYAQAHGGELLYEDAVPHGARFKLVVPAKRVG